MKFWEEGEDPDPRFTLANERTFLAWIRTSLAFLAGGIALEAFAVDIVPYVFRTVLSVLVVFIGLLFASGAMFRWLCVERSMRRGEPLPLPVSMPVLAVGAGVASTVAVVLLLLAVGEVL